MNLMVTGGARIARMVKMTTTKYPFYDAAGIGRFVDEGAVLEKMRENPTFRDADFTDEELSFIRSCRFYWRTLTQDEIRRLAEERRIAEPIEFEINPCPDRSVGWWGY